MLDYWKFTAGEYVTDGRDILIVRSQLVDIRNDDFVYSLVSAYGSRASVMYIPAVELEKDFYIAH